VNETYAGICHLDDGPISKFQRAVICWSGPLSECLFKTTQHPWQPPFKPNKKLLRDWHGMMMQQFARLSNGDQAGIIGYGLARSPFGMKLRRGSVKKFIVRRPKLQLLGF
jgi:hypothetical protein